MWDILASHGHVIASVLAALWTISSAVIATLLAVARKTYAKRDDVQQLNERVNLIQVRIETLPTRSDITDLRRDLGSLNASIEGLREQYTGVNHLVQMLVEHKINKS
ncbi:DUF2730 family protein [Salmonella enterica]|uniref:DUF2730 family protein n=1 Tax=Salmonella enterica TaxID=28901 RepID=UPI0009B11A46|nr:DUF2730 family protein [Salmonella enterica]EBG8070645.1 DUF2730 family protein [Salmonella enterica subsp. enterica serovar Elisabethville]EED8015224.1 DUF2730 family protein [Salmonella enterica subsp. enterica]EEH1521408.1 DUF2730 family protein [Salmonella enterica subsp. enterica serovar Telelkebir]HCM2492368.1 DUF2730 family protein [Salmonella enterica subsp. enterica serovar Lehrte]EAA8605602.1 DUF2730 family protein [Salmonella enterica]